MHTGSNTSWLLVQSTAGAIELTVEKVRDLATEGNNSLKTVRTITLTHWLRLPLIGFAAQAKLTPSSALSTQVYLDCLSALARTKEAKGPLGSFIEFEKVCL